MARAVKRKKNKPIVDVSRIEGDLPTIRAVGDRVVAIQISTPKETVTPGGVILPRKISKHQIQGQVLDVGPGIPSGMVLKDYPQGRRYEPKDDDTVLADERHPYSTVLKPGMWIVWNPKSGVKFGRRGKEMSQVIWVLDHSRILAYLAPDDPKAGPETAGPVWLGLGEGRPFDIDGNAFIQKQLREARAARGQDPETGAWRT